MRRQRLAGLGQLALALAILFLLIVLGSFDGPMP